MSKFIIVTGGVVSSLGKGITAASLGRLLKNRGLSVAVLKMDPYLNVDPGTMSPYQHGEVFVTDDGAECDLDIGHYERFLDISCTKKSNFTSGKVFSSILAKERAGNYHGKTIQYVPHVTNEIKDRIKTSAPADTDIVIVEIGGTIGDMEGLAFIEAVRQLRMEVGQENICFVHCVLIPYLEAAKEIKTKPAQSSVKELTRLGIQPDILVCRTNSGIVIDEELRDKLAMFCNLRSKEHVIHNSDAKCLYEVPLMLQKEGLDDIVCKHLKLKTKKAEMTDWKAMVKQVLKKKPVIEIAIVGKYIEVPDAYISITEALKHAGYANDADVKVKLVSAVEIEEKGAETVLSSFKGLLIPGGSGERGIEGKLKAAEYARLNDVPFLAIDNGLEVAAIEFAKNVMGLEDATSREFDEQAKVNIIDIMESQKSVADKDGTNRLGLYTCKLVDGTKAREIYGVEETAERHRHRFEFNNKFKKDFEDNGMVFSGVNPESELVEIAELPNNNFYVAVQFHPDFKSRPYAAHPLFKALVKACKE